MGDYQKFPFIRHPPSELRITAAVQSLRRNIPHALPCRIDFHDSVSLIAEVRDEHTAKAKPSFRKKLWSGFIALLLVVIVWLIWQFTAYNNAVLTAKEAGFEWYCENPITLIREDWRNALQKETWGSHSRELVMEEIPDLDRYRGMLHHLRLTGLELSYCKKLQNVDALEGLTALQILIIENGDALQNVDGIKNLTTLRYLNLNGCIMLQNVDTLKGITNLKQLYLPECTALQNVNGLKNLTALIELDLRGCDELQSVDGLKGLPELNRLNLSACNKLQNVDGIKDLTDLDWLDLSDCDELQNVDGLKGLTSLTRLHLNGCIMLQNVDGIKGLTNLQELYLNNCNSLQNVDSLKSLTSLTYLDLHSCDKIPAAALRELRTALPNTKIKFPDGRTTPP